MPDLYSVQTENLTKQFGKFTAVKNVSIQVKKGEIFGFLGANGAGKTTMIRMLCGLLLPSSGSGSVVGFDVFSESEAIKKNIGYMSQKFSLYDDLTISENIEFYGGIYGLKNSRLQQKKNELLQELGLQHLQNRMTVDLPLGFKQRLALGCALLHEPRVLFLDEPTSGVDPAARREFWKIIYQTAETGTTIFVTTHFMDEAEYCHRVSIMHAGEIIALDSPGALRKKYGQSSMQNVFVALIKKQFEQEKN